MKVKDLREIAKRNGLKESEDLFSKRVIVLDSGLIIEISEDNCEDLTDCEEKVIVLDSGLIIEISEDDCEDLPDGW